MRFSIYLYLMLTLVLFFQKTETIKNDQKSDDIKIAVLIIASNSIPIYLQLEKVWKAYMNADPSHVEAYFIRGNPDLKKPYEIQGDTIWSQSPEILKPGIINKTISAMEALHNRIDEFDYVLRTNLSSFYVFPRLIDFLKKCPKERFYAGAETAPHSGIGSGSGFIISPDIFNLMVENRNHFWNNRTSYDDNIIGNFLKSKGITLHVTPYTAFYDFKNMLTNIKDIPPNVFQIRVKFPYSQEYRMNEILVHTELLKKFYGISFSPSF